MSLDYISNVSIIRCVSHLGQGDHDAEIDIDIDKCKIDNEKWTFGKGQYGKEKPELDK